MSSYPSYQSQNHPFEYVIVDRLIHGTTAVRWELAAGFDDSGSYAFTLQYNGTGADGWTDITSVTDAFEAEDSTQRIYSEIDVGTYRVKLITGEDTYYSGGAVERPGWTLRDVSVAAETRRRFIESARISGSSDQRGWILFRKHWGAPCPDCLDATTGESLNPRCSTCHGTSIDGGYFDPYPVVWTRKTSQTQVQESPLGPLIEDNVVIQTALLPARRLSEHDVFVADGSDRRYNIQSIDFKPRWKGRSLLQTLNLSVLGPSHAVYLPSSSGGSLPWQGSYATGGGVSYKVKVSEDDAAADYLEQKLVAGDAVDLNVLNGGADEALEVNMDVDTATEINLAPQIRVDINDNVQVRMKNIKFGLDGTTGELEPVAGAYGAWAGIAGNVCPTGA